MVVECLLRRKVLELLRGIHRSDRDSSLSARISQAKHCAVYGYLLRASRISHLLRLKRPRAIALRVAKIVIQPFKAMLRARLWPHISKKIHKLSPLWIDRNPSTTIVRIKTMCRARRSSDHALPRGILGASASSLPVTMLAKVCVLHASTGLMASSSKLKAAKRFQFAAVALAFPSGLADGGVSDSSNDSQVVKCLPRKIQRFHKYRILRKSQGGQLCPSFRQP